MSGSIDRTVVAANVAAVRARVAAAHREWEHPVQLVAVTKGFAADAVTAAVEAGCDRIGENYAQELMSKADTLDGLGDRRPAVEFIGRLQSNKVRQLVGIVDLWASVDRSSLVREIAKRDPGASILIQINSTGEANKGGCDPGAASDLITEAIASGLDVRGAMTVGPTGRPPSAAKPGFERVRAIVDEAGLGVCSMGMTADLEVAVAAGSTDVRIGTGLFGWRD